MNDTIEVSGIVLSAMPIGEQDKRVELLTRELGKISAFARGARRPGSALMAAANPFVFGTFSVVAGRNSYVVTRADVLNYFTELAAAQPGVYYGFYFLELAGQYSWEGIDGTETLNLLYLSLKALLNRNLSDELVRRVFELRLMTINGDFALPSQEDGRLSASAHYAASYAVTAPLSRLYTFEVTDEVQTELGRLADRSLARVIDRPIRSLAILQKLRGTPPM